MFNTCSQSFVLIGALFNGLVTIHKFEHVANQVGHTVFPANIFPSLFFAESSKYLDSRGDKSLFLFQEMRQPSSTVGSTSGNSWSGGGATASEGPSGARYPSTAGKATDAEERSQARNSRRAPQTPPSRASHSFNNSALAMEGPIPH